MTYFRIHNLSVESEEDLLDPSRVSRAWVGQYTRECPACLGDGMLHDDDDVSGSCPRCRGQGQVEDTRHGVSVCDSIESLSAYLSSREWSREGTVVLELDGVLSEDEDHERGALLIRPSRIVRELPLSVLEVTS